MCALSLDLDRESFEANPILSAKTKQKEEIADDERIQLELLPAKKRFHRILRMNPRRE